MEQSTAQDARALAALLDRATAVDAPAEQMVEARRAVGLLFAQSQDRIYRLCQRYTGNP